MATATYTFSTGVPNIQPAVYAAGTSTPDLNTDDEVTNSSGVLTLDLDIGDYYAQWRWEGDTHQTSGEVASPDTLGEVAAALPDPTTGDPGDVVTVNDDSTGFELAPGGSGGSPTGVLVSKDLIFTESDDPGVLTATLAIPAGATILGIACHTEVAWAEPSSPDGAQLNIEDSGGAIWGGEPDTGPQSWKSSGGAVEPLDQIYMWGDFENGSTRGTLSSSDFFAYYPAGTTITATVTTTQGADGSPTGVTRLKVSYFTAADETDAAFEATP